ncbi:MAG: hypothetical protein AB7F64_09330 [Gammaproteobacteria bacterium]
MLSSIQIDEKIKSKRLDIYNRFLELYDEKNNAIDQRVRLSWDYDRRILILIRDILIHTRDNWNHESDHKRLGSLNNLVRAALLLQQSFTSLYNIDYSPVSLVQTGWINLWCNLQFLVRYQISPQGFGVSQTLPITTVDTNHILSELFDLIDNVLVREIRIGLKLQPIYTNFQCDIRKLPIDMRNHFDRHELEVRQPYRDPHRLPLLEAFAMYGREKLRITKMLEVIHFANTLDVTTANGKMALLRQLQIIGESSTDKNFSYATKRIARDTDWQLLIKLRHKLSHNEWDIHSGFLDTNCTTTNMQAIQADLVILKISITQLQQTHNQIGVTKNRMLCHYDPAWYLRVETRILFLDFIRDCYIARVINKRQLIELKNMLNNDIRHRPKESRLPLQIKSYIENIFEKTHTDYHKSQHLTSRYQQLVKAFSNDINYYKKLESPSQKSMDRRLVSHQVNIRAFCNLLDYSDVTYEQDRLNHHFSFNSLRLIRFIQQEIMAIREVLSPLEGSDVLSLDFPEDTLDIYINENDKIFKDIFNSQNHQNFEMEQSIRDIKAYYDLIRKPLTLRIDGLVLNGKRVRRGEVGRIHSNELLRNSACLLKQIEIFRRKCIFYTSLVYHPEIVEACFYHMAKIQKYVVVLKLSEVSSSEQLPNLEEFRALRNFISHGIDLLETTDILLLELMTRYASMFINKLLPAIDQTKHDTLRGIITRNTLLANSIYRVIPKVQSRDATILGQNRIRSLSF